MNREDKIYIAGHTGLAGSVIHRKLLKEDDEVILWGTGRAELIRKAVQYKGSIRYDTSKPDGMPKRLLDSQKLYAMGWRPCIPFEEGIRRTIAWYKENAGKNRRIP